MVLRECRRVRIRDAGWIANDEARKSGTVR